MIKDLTDSPYFRKRRLFAAVTASPAGPLSAMGPRPTGGLLARIRAKMAGTVHVRPGVDLTAPTGEPWEAEGTRR